MKNLTKILFPYLILSGQFYSSVRADEFVKPGTEINIISQQTTLMIVALEDGDPIGRGSGSLIANNGQICTGVTNAHVVDLPGESISLLTRTYDGEVYEVESAHKFQNEDLAIITFACNRDYSPITVATYQISPGQEVYLSGWPADASPDGRAVRQFTSGSVSTILDEPFRGYTVGYTNVTNSGMSGGQVLDAAGRLIAIHGIGALEDTAYIANQLNISEELASGFADKTGFNYGIPVASLLAGSQHIEDMNIEDMTIVYSTPQVPINASSADATSTNEEFQYSPTESDRVSYDDILSNFDGTVDSLEGAADAVCSFISC